MLTAFRRLIAMMTPRERTRFWMLVAISFCLTVLEVGSVVSILPFLRLLAEPDLIETVPILIWLFEAGGFNSTNSFMIWAGVGVFAITIVGLVLKTITIWLTTHFALMRSYSFSARLLANYLHQPYEWFLARNTSDLRTAILAEVDKAVAQALLPATRIIPEIFTVVLLVLVLCLLEPEIAIGGALLLGGLYGAIFLVVRRILERLGRQRLLENQRRFHIVQEATGGLKELKLMGLEEGFLVRFRVAAFRMAKAQTGAQIIAAVPRQAIEAMAFGGIILLILVLLVRGEGDVSAIVPTLGLVAAVGLRMIPALQQVYQRAVLIQQSQAVLEQLHLDMTNLTPDPIADRERRDTRTTLPLTQALELSEIRYAYPGKNQPALDGLNLTIQANKTIGIVGGTGAGKTTLIDILLGLLEPAAGEMRVDGEAITAETRRAWQKTLGYVPQTIFLSNGTVAENIAFGVAVDKIDMARVEHAARIAALYDFVRIELPQGFDTPVGERGVRLSGGQRQRIGIARALYHDPSTLILDEATSALDTLTEAAVMEAVTAIAGQKTIIMIAHRLSTVRNCDAIFLMRHGRVVAQGSFDELVAMDSEFRKMAGDLAKSPPSAS